MFNIVPTMKIMQTAPSVVIETQRLILRNWLDSDKKDFFEINSNKDVMEFFPSIYTQKQSDDLLEKMRDLISRNGWGFWACQIKSTNQLIGFVGLNNPDYPLPFSPCTEIGWRLNKKFWYNGYASEAARAVLQYAFDELKLEQVVSFTVKSNIRSIAVMERIGMQFSGTTFQHPRVLNTHLSEHVLYVMHSRQFSR
ncbi:GNAT family N-acetyltransferase [Sessilibacter sp. MAH1]